MAENSKIGWTDSTVNFWSGCTKVSPGCAHCYAETMDNRHLIEKVSHWGKNAPRLKSVGAVKLAQKLNREFLICDHCGVGQAGAVTMDEGCVNHQCPSHDLESAKCSYHRRRIFSLSRGDWLDDEVPIEWLAEMLDTIRRCADVTWILCTKRPENWRILLKEIIVGDGVSDVTYPNEFFFWIQDWLDGHAQKNIILLTSVENQAMADKRIPELLKIPAVCRGLSLEPLLEPVSLRWLAVFENGMASKPRPSTTHHLEGLKKLNWLIIGCESGPNRRDCDNVWIENLVEQGQSAGVATFVKQVLVNGKVTTDINQFPPRLQIQQSPQLK